MSGMRHPRQDTPCSPRSRRPPLPALVLLAGLAYGPLGGCAALTNPAAVGYPVHRLPPEWLGESREDKVTIPLTALGRGPTTIYRLGPGDVLAIYIEGVLGERTQLPPTYYPSQLAPLA